MSEGEDAGAGALVLPAPAKLNLFLHVTGQRPDGYHMLQTVCQLLDWGDEIALSVRRDGRIERTEGLDDVAPENDLAVRAAVLLRSEADVALGATIAVRKKVPAGAGLGGGSSDAATVLLGLNRLWKLKLPRECLADLAVSLGADVPLFVRGRSAFAEGIGDRLQPIDLPERWYAVIWPGISVPTAGIFQAPELTRNTRPLTISELPGTVTRNDLEAVAVRRHRAIAEALAWLADHGDARMSGSGSSVFAAVADESTARAVAAASPWPAWAVRGVNTSPLHRALGFAD